MTRIVPPATRTDRLGELVELGFADLRACGAYGLRRLKTRPHTPLQSASQTALSGAGEQAAAQILPRPAGEVDRAAGGRQRERPSRAAEGSGA